MKTSASAFQNGTAFWCIRHKNVELTFLDHCRPQLVHHQQDHQIFKVSISPTTVPKSQSLSQIKIIIHLKNGLAFLEYMQFGVVELVSRFRSRVTSSLRFRERIDVRRGTDASQLSKDTTGQISVSLTFFSHGPQMTS